MFEDPMIAQLWNPATAAGRAALDAVVTRQAQIIAYIDDYKLLMIATLAVVPLLIIFTKTSRELAADETLLPGLDQQLSVAKHALAVLVGRAPGNWSPPEFDLTAM